MKTLAFLIVAALFTAATWDTNFEQAQQKAKQENKLILLNFSGSDWCGPCMKLKRDVFESSEFQSYASANLVLVNADFPRLKKNQPGSALLKQNEALADKYNPKGIFPYTLLIDANGKVLKSWEGNHNLTATSFLDQLQK